MIIILIFPITFISILFSDNFSLEHSLLSLVVNSQYNSNPSKGPTQYSVHISFDPKVAGKALGKRSCRGPKNTFKCLVFKCACLSFDSKSGVCKHICAVLLKEFNSQKSKKTCFRDVCHIHVNVLCSANEIQYNFNCIHSIYSLQF